MSWEERLIEAEELGRLGAAVDSDLPTKIGALIEHQREHWPLLRDGYEAFERIESRRLKVEEAEVVVQHNPRRIRSTAAAVDPKAVASRPCFLCGQNLPAEEKGIGYRDFVILCNPYPILERHLSIVHREHGEQKIDGNIGSLLDLARDLGPDYFALYNGPQCGASAPDHLHFQACSSKLLPISEHLFDAEPRLADDCPSCEETAANTFELFSLGGCGRTTIVLRGGRLQEVEDWLSRLIRELGERNDSAGSEAEPMLNIVCTWSNRLWTVYVFPRAKHRPASFFAEGADRLTISPGAIDMAGVVVVPEREHFDRLNGERLAAIYREVSRNEEVINEMLDWMTSTEETFLGE
jgi:hypothetical protein